MIYINNCKLLIINRCKDIKKYQLLNYSPLLVPPTSPSPSEFLLVPPTAPTAPTALITPTAPTAPIPPTTPIPARAAPTPSLPVRLAPHPCPCGSHPPPSFSESLRVFHQKIFPSFSTNYKKLSKKVAKKFAG